MASKANMIVRITARKNGVAFWQIADYLQIAESTFTRMMRHELPAEKKQEILEIIEELKGEEK